MKRILISLILLSVLVVLPAYGTEIVNGVEQGLGGDTYDGTGVDTIVAGTSIAVPSQLTATTTGVSLGTATATSLAVPSGFTATTAGAQATALTVTNNITAGGRIGIGTTAPAGAVDISPTGGTNTYPLTIRQSVDNKGITLYNIYDVSTNHFDISMSGNAGKINSTNSITMGVNAGTIITIANDRLQISDNMFLALGNYDYYWMYDEATHDRLEFYGQGYNSQLLQTVTAGSGFNFLTDVTLSKDVVYSGSGSGTAYGGIYQYSNTTAITIASSEVYYTVTNWDANSSDSNLTTPTFGSDYIQVTNAGVYFVSVSLAFQGTNNDDICFAIYSDDGATKEESLHLTATVQAAGDWTPVSISGLVRLAAGEKIYLKVENKTAANNILIDDANMTLFQVGG